MFIELRVVCRVFVGLVIASMLLLPLLPAGNAVAAEPVGLQALSGIVYIIQGPSDVNPNAAGPDSFYCFRIVTFELPYNASRVYVNVPQGAHNISVLASGASVNSSGFGRETTGSMAGTFYIDVPATQARTTLYTNTTNTTSSFLAPGSSLVNLTCDSTGLRLSGGMDDGVFVSAPIDVPNAIGIVGANLTVSGESLGNVTYEASNDQGATWITLANATEASFASSGADVLVRLVFSGNTSSGFDPIVTSFKLAARYTPPKTLMTVHVSYIWEQEFVDGSTELNLTEAISYSGDGSFVAMIYLMRGYQVESSSIDLTLDANGTMSTRSGMDLYLNSTYPIEGYKTIVVTVTEPKSTVPWALYISASCILLVLAGAVVYSRYSKSAKSPGPPAAAAADESISESPSELDGAESTKRREGLVARKKELLGQLESTKARLAKAEISKADAEREISRIKQEYKPVRNELNRLPKAEAGTAAGVGAGSGEPTSGSYESLLASISRLDEDFEKGRLPEGTYKNLRKEYVSKAAALKAAEASGSLAQEKLKLLEAISALDSEHDLGEVDERVYQELRAAYKKELANIVREMEQQGGE